MNRRTAIASSVSLMATVVVGGVAFAALGGIDVLGFDSEPGAAPLEIIETTPTPTSTSEMIVEVLAIDTTTATVADPQLPDTTARGQVGNTPGTTAPTVAPIPPTAAPTVPPTVAPTTPTTPKTTVPPATTSPATTSPPPASTLPAGVPKDWPAGTPIPPKPVGCVNGQLEDNGVWNCEH